MMINKNNRNKSSLCNSLKCDMFSFRNIIIKLRIKMNSEEIILKITNNQFILFILEERW